MPARQPDNGRTACSTIHVLQIFHPQMPAARLYGAVQISEKRGAAMSVYDFIVIGSGPAGKRAAVQAAKLGKSVLLIENRLRVGGVSVHTGTIPSKTMREPV